jgi:Xaa-Pro dipeptidase
MLTPETLPDLQRALADANIDGWLLFDFQGTNPIASGALALDGFITRRVFAYIPREGVPVAVTHDIEQGPWHRCRSSGSGCATAAGKCSSRRWRRL